MKVTLKDKRQEVAGVVSFILEPDEETSWQAGQFMRYQIPDEIPDNRGVSRFFTISSAPFEKNLMITTRFAEKGSSFKKDLQSLKIGDQIEASGPSGAFIVDDPNREYVFIAGGIGITPYRSILLDLDHNQKPINVTLLYANRDENIVFKDELEGLKEKNPKLKIKYFIDPEKIDEEAIRSSVDSLQSTVFYFSGPQPMVEALVDLAKQTGVPEEHIKTDYFPGYSGI